MFLADIDREFDGAAEPEGKYLWELARIKIFVHAQRGWEYKFMQNIKSTEHVTKQQPKMMTRKIKVFLGHKTSRESSENIRKKIAKKFVNKNIDNFNLMRIKVVAWCVINKQDFIVRSDKQHLKASCFG